MNAFFASVEMHDFPELRGKPVAVTNGQQGTCIITCSYEARAYGIRTGMRMQQARQLCPELIQRPARPHAYAEVSTRIMQAMSNVCPDMEIFSVDEAFIDMTRCQRLHGTPARMGRMLKQAVYEASSLLCSVGISGDKTTAKYAAKLNKPDGLTIIPPWEARETLADAPVTELCGIAKGIGRFLAEHGVHVCGDMQHLPISVLAQRFGNPGRRIWYMAQGLDPDPLHTEVAPPKSIGHGKVMPPNTRDREAILTYLQHMSVKVCARLRRYNFEAQHYFIGLRSTDGWLGNKLKLTHPGNDSRPLFNLCRYVLQHYWHGEGVFQVQVTALDPQPAELQQDLFNEPTINRQLQSQLNRMIDDVNERYGEMCLTPARLLNRSEMPNVIAPSWKPKGHRQSI
jgi:DNA polymerase-4